MNDDQMARLRERTGGDAPEWLAELLRDVETMRARLQRLEDENRALTEQLGFYRRRVAA